MPIETIAAGDLVQSFHPQTQEVSSKQVEETFIRESSELVHVSVGDERITTTPEHPFYVAQKGFALITIVKSMFWLLFIWKILLNHILVCLLIPLHSFI